MRQGWLTPKQYAARHGVTKQIVCAWCRSGYFGPDAQRLDNNWMIRDTPMAIPPVARRLGRPRGAKDKAPRTPRQA